MRHNGRLNLAARPSVALTAVRTAPEEPFIAYVDLPKTPCLPDSTTEEELLAKVRRLAKMTGWKCYHTRDSRKSELGFPDVVLTNGDEVLIYELKDNRRKTTVEQEQWLQLLQHTGKVEAGIWRPNQWAAIVERLTRKRGEP
jgi:hypothetical protein